MALPRLGSPPMSKFKQANITGLMKELGVESYEDFHAWSVENRANFFELMVNRLNIRIQHSLLKMVVDLSRAN